MRTSEREELARNEGENLPDSVGREKEGLRKAPMVKSCVFKYCGLPPNASRFLVLEEEVSRVFGEDNMEERGFAAMEGLKQFMCIGTDTVHYVVVSSSADSSLFQALILFWVG